MAATRWSQVLLYDYGRHAQYISEEKVQDFWKVCSTIEHRESLATC